MGLAPEKLLHRLSSPTAPNVTNDGFGPRCCILRNNNLSSRHQACGGNIGDAGPTVKGLVWVMNPICWLGTVHLSWIGWQTMQLGRATRSNFEKWFVHGGIIFPCFEVVNYSRILTSRQKLVPRWSKNITKQAKIRNRSAEWFTSQTSIVALTLEYSSLNKMSPHPTNKKRVFNLTTKTQYNLNSFLNTHRSRIQVTQLFAIDLLEPWARAQDRSVRVIGWIWLIYGCFQKWGWAPQIIHFNRVFHHKPSIWVPLFLETPICWCGWYGWYDWKNHS